MYKILIPLEQCPAGFKEDPAAFSQALFSCTLLPEWRADSSLPRGTLGARLGDFGDIEVATPREPRCCGDAAGGQAETMALLLTNEVDFEPFEDAIEEELLQRHPKVAI